MGNVQYDWLEGIVRIIKARDRSDPRWIEIIVYHAALEHEIDVVLIKSLKRGDAVTGGSPRFTFGHKVAILKAAWQGKAEDADKLCRILVCFNELRNAVAHPDKKKTKAELRNLMNAYRALVPNLEHVPDVGEVAQGVCAFMGDGILPHDLEAIMNGVDHLANVVIPKAFGTRLEAPEKKLRFTARPARTVSPRRTRSPLRPSSDTGRPAGGSARPT